MAISATLKKFCYILSAFFLISIIAVACLIFYTRYEISSAYNNKAESYIRNEQAKLNLDCNYLRADFLSFMKDPIKKIIADEKSTINGYLPEASKKLVQDFHDKLNKCSSLSRYDQQNQLQLIRDPEFFKLVPNEYSLIYTLLTFSESDQTCNENCRLSKSKAMSDSYKKIMGIQSAE